MAATASPPVEDRPTVLTLVDYYLPGYRAGGPIKSLHNMIFYLGDEFAFRLITRDRDLGSTSPYSASDMHAGEAGELPARQPIVTYVPPNGSGAATLAAAMRSAGYDLLYLNSLFSRLFTVWPLLLRRLRLVDRRPTVIAPRGELSAGALSLKSLRKLIYLKLAKLFGLYSDVIWQASGTEEAAAVRKYFGSKSTVLVAADLPNPIDSATTRRWPRRQTELRVLFLSRIAKNKNLAFVLDVLQGIRFPVQLSVAGPIEDHDYWALCTRRIQHLPSNVRIEMLGAVPPDETAALYRSHDVLFLPSTGESFGHVIVEALSEGCPVLISDQTPWKRLRSEGVGWDLPLHAPDQFREALRSLFHMSDVERVTMRRMTLEWSRNNLEPQTSVEAQRRIFHAALEGEHRRSPIPRRARPVV